MNPTAEPLLDPGCPTDSVPDVVEFGPTDFSALLYFYFNHPGRLDREDPFHPFALYQATYGEGFSESLMATGNNGSAEELNSFPLSFDDLDMDID